MDIIRFGRNVTLIALLLSLLFHTSSIFYFFLQKKQSPLDNPLSTTVKEEKETSRQAWAETKARAGNFGAPVFFQDEPEQIQEQAQPEREEQKQMNSDEIKEINDELAAAENSHQEQEKTTEPTPIQATPAVKIQETKIPRPAPPKKTKKAIAENPAQKKPLQQASNPVPMKKNLPSLSQLAQGFLQHSKDTGSHSVSMIGMKNGMPSDEQLKYERYLQKLEWCFQNSLRINSNRIPRLAETHTVHVHLILNRDGTIKQLNLAKSSKNIVLDQFILFVFKDASSSFPPVPQYIKDDPFNLTCIVPFYVM